MSTKPNETSCPETPTSTDARFEFLAAVVHRSLRLKPDRWAKLLSVDDARKIISEFLDQPEPPYIFFTQSGPGILGVSTAPLNSSGHPAISSMSGNSNGGSSSRMKSLYFLKKKLEPVSSVDPRSSLLYGDLSPNPLDQVLTFLDEVFPELFLTFHTLNIFERL